MKQSNFNLQQFMDKVKAMENGEQIDLSSDEDLSVAIMNLISIEEHLFFTGNKTGKVSYFSLLNEIRKMRVELLKMLIKDYEGEVWCISKHLLAASMRVMEVGTKALKKGDDVKAYELFTKSFHLYNLFWALNLDMISKEDVKGVVHSDIIPEKEQPIEHQEKDMLSKMSGFIGRVLDCCKE